MKCKININLLTQIIAIKSVSHDIKSCHDVLSLIKNLIDLSDIPCEVVVFDSQPSLVAGSLESANFLILSHADIVPAEDKEFVLKQIDSKLVGRGVIDMKGPLLVSLEVFIELWNKGRRDIIFVVTTDEEVGGFLGTAKLLSRFEKIKMAVVLDGNTEGIAISQRAPFHIEITHRGKSAHASRPSLGINSLEKLSKCCLSICAKIDCASITKLHGGEATNKIPDIAVATLDIRIETRRMLEVIVEIISNQTKKFGCTWEAIDEPLFFEVDVENLFISNFAKLSGRKFCQENGTSDARFLSDRLGIPVVVTSGKGGNIHGCDEWITIQSLNRLKGDLTKFFISL